MCPNGDAQQSLDRRYTRFAILVAAMALMGAPACDDDEPATGTDTGNTQDAGDSGDDTVADVGDAGDAVEDVDAHVPIEYHATIRRTSYGVPHILGDTLGDVTFGQAYAMAEDDPCVMAHNIVQVRSERARYFGPGENDANINSDFAHLAMQIYAQAEAGWDALDENGQAAIGGYVAGYNQWLADTGVDNIPGDCAGAEWVQPISTTDALAYYISVALFASGRILMDSIATAEPPPGTDIDGGLQTLDFPDFRFPNLGSNGWALGSDMTEGGRGMLLINPHFEWEGNLHFGEAHLTIPGELNIYGETATGVPGLIQGFTDEFAWTGTVSIANRLTVYMLTLNPSNALEYQYDDEFRPIEGTEYTIQVLQDGGALEDLARTMYRSHYGPMINVSPLGWSRQIALTFRDANENHLDLAAQFIGMDLADTFEEFQAIHDEVQGLPWVNTIAVSADGEAWYSDSASVPNLNQEAIDTWLEERESGLAGTVYERGAVLLDGSDSVNEWVDDPESPRPGLVPFADSPELTRTDYIANANGSHWLTNPAEPLEGYSPLFGPERTPRDPRTRLNLVLLSETGEGAAAGDDGLFNLEEMQAVLYNERAMLAELIQDQVAARCDGVDSVMVGADEVDIAEACDIIGAWDGRLDLASAGAVLWREFLGSFPAAELMDEGDVFAVPFDPEDAVATPHTLAAAPAEGDDPILVALAEAVQRLTEAGIALDATLGDTQFTIKGDEQIPIPGGLGFPEGAFNVVDYRGGGNSTIPDMERGPVINGATGLTEDGYVINAGTNFAMMVEYTDDGPHAMAILSRSQSVVADSPYFSDQTEMFSQEQWRPVLYTEEDIAADPELTTTEVSGTW